MRHLKSMESLKCKCHGLRSPRTRRSFLHRQRGCGRGGSDQPKHPSMRRRSMSRLPWARRTISIPSFNGKEKVRASRKAGFFRTRQPTGIFAFLLVRACERRSDNRPRVVPPARRLYRRQLSKTGQRFRYRRSRHTKPIARSDRVELLPVYEPLPPMPASGLCASHHSE